MIDTRILKLLRADKSKAAVYAEIARKRRQYDNLISREEAAYILAAEMQIDLFKYLDEKSIERVRDLLSEKQSASTENNHSNGKTQKTRPSNKSKELIIRVDGRTLPASALPPNLARESKEMAEVYPLLYILENSIRFLIMSRLSDAYGTDWWNLANVSSRIKNSAQKLMEDEKQNKWYRPRGDHPIFYTTVGNLSNIISSNWDIFKDTGLSSPQWVEFHIGEIIETSRNTIMHCNPLSKKHIRRLHDVFDDWMQIMAN